MCNCGCNTCETNNTTLMLNENKAPRAILSEGLKHHIDNDKPLTEHLYRAGSRAYFDLFAEARSLYSRGILEFTNEDDLALLTETNLGHFGMFEGKKVPLDFPIELNEQMDIYDEIANMEFGMDYDQLGDNEKEWVRDEIDNMNYKSINENEYYVTRNLGRGQGKGLVKSVESDFTEPRIFSKEEAEKYIQKAQSGGAIPGQMVAYWVSDKDMNRIDESNSNYPNFDLNKNIKYQDTSISSGMWRYTGTEQGGKGVYRNLNNGQILAFDRSDFDIFKNNLSSHFDIDEVTIEERIVNILEAKKKKAKKKNNKPIGKPMRSSSGGKAYKVYVKDPKTKKIKTVRFGSGGLRAKINDSKARAAFAKRHKCSQKKDRTKAGYWSCRLPRYAKLLGLKSSFSGFW